MKKMFIKKFISVCIAFLLLFNMLFFMTGCSEVSLEAEIALITDVGQLMDAGFNQSTWEGVSAFAKNNNKRYQYYTPNGGENATDEDRIKAMEKAIANGAKVLVIPGFAQSRAITKVATDHPDVKFIYVDGWSLGLPNVTAIVFKEEESGYIAGYAAVKDGYRNVGGVFGGGGTNPACNRYGYGFIQGARDAAYEKEEKIDIRYTYKFGETFASSTNLEELALEWFKSGTEVIFACGGSMFYSVVSAANKNDGGKVIGVDVDQSVFSSRVITSAVKEISTAVQKILKSYYQNEWDSKLAYKEVKLGVNDDATGIPYPRSKFKKFSTFQYNNVIDKIKNGVVEIDTKLPADCSKGEWIEEKNLNDDYITIHFE